MIEELTPFLLGKDPTRIELLYEQLYRMNFWVGTTELTAISAIEMCCWDVLGKSLNAPVYKLLGGAYRDRIRLYAHVHPEGEAHAGRLRRRRAESGSSRATAALKTTVDHLGLARSRGAGEDQRSATSSARARRSRTA